MITNMPETKRIALLLPQDIGYSRAVLRGIQEYAVARPHWIFRDAPPTREILEPLQEWKPHGIIALLFDQQVADSDFTEVGTDDAANLVISNKLEFLDDIQDRFGAGQFGLDSGGIDQLLIREQALLDQQSGHLAVLTVGGRRCRGSVAFSGCLLQIVVRCHFQKSPGAGRTDPFGFYHLETLSAFWAKH